MLQSGGINLPLKKPGLVKKKPQVKHALGALRLLPQLRLIWPGGGLSGLGTAQPAYIHQIRSAFGKGNADHAVVLPRGTVVWPQRCLAPA